MIPEEWRPVHRGGDETAPVLGFTEQRSPRRVVPFGRLGVPLAGPVTPARAEELVAEDAAAERGRRWWCRLPHPMRRAIDVLTPEDSWQWRRVVVLGVEGDEARIRLDFAAPAEMMMVVTVPVPVGGILLAEKPEPEPDEGWTA